MVSPALAPANTEPSVAGSAGSSAACALTGHRSIKPAAIANQANRTRGTLAELIARASRTLARAITFRGPPTLFKRMHPQEADASVLQAAHRPAVAAGD